ncbi:unnamed protein product [Closterium sp. Naga37s-1]|nr:unnamed protein product [Closterium sp. Naga37s-1]
MDERRLLTDEEESGPLRELLRRHGRPTFNAPRESQIRNEEEESGLLAELLRRQRQVEENPIIAAVMDPPSPRVEVPRGSNESTGQPLLRRQGQLEELTMAPCMHQRRLPVNPQEPVLSPSHSHADVPALEEGGCLGATGEGGMVEGMMMLEALMLQDGGMQGGGMMWGGGMMQEGGMMESSSFEVALKYRAQEGQGSNSMDPALPGDLTGPDSPCLNSQEDASLPSSPPPTPAPAAAAAACPPPAFFTPPAPGVCCTPACAGACCSLSATPSACHEGETGHTVTVQEPPATWTSLIGSEKFAPSSSFPSPSSSPPPPLPLPLLFPSPCGYVCVG